MDLNAYLEIARYLLLLLAGFWVARKARGPIRNIILSLMTPQQRMSESSFHIQTRLGTIIGVILAIAIAAGLNWAVNEITQLITPPHKNHSPSSEQTTTIPQEVFPPPIPYSTTSTPTDESIPKQTDDESIQKRPNPAPIIPPPPPTKNTGSFSKSMLSKTPNWPESANPNSSKFSR